MRRGILFCVLLLSFIQKPEAINHMVVLKEVTFDFKSVILSEEQRQRLDTNIMKIQWLIKFHNDTLWLIDGKGNRTSRFPHGRASSVELIAHSDLLEAPEGDSLLSYQRGMVVRKYLYDSGKINLPVFIKAHGGNDPYYTKDSGENDPALNRRVEFRVH